MERYSIWRCAYCEPIKTRSFEESKAEAKARGWDDNMGGTGQNLNPSSCPYEYVEIEGIIYKRDKGNIFDDRNDRPDLYEESIPPFDPKTEPSCHDCGVPFGNVHHVECDSERCPICAEQFLSCSCGMSMQHIRKKGMMFGKRVKYYKNMPKAYRAKMKNIGHKTLRRVIEK